MSLHERFGRECISHQYFWGKINKSIQSTTKSHSRLISSKSEVLFFNHSRKHFRELTSEEFVDGCEHWVPIEGKEITHAYTFSYVGEICTMALVDGGFKTSVVLPEAGQYTGKIMVNGEEKGRYTLEAK